MRSALHDSSAIFFLREASLPANEGRKYVVPAAGAAIAAELFPAQFELAGGRDRTRADRLASAISRALAATDSKPS
jgi:hypothetical protein